MYAKIAVKNTGILLAVILLFSACTSREIRQARTARNNQNYVEALKYAIAAYNKDKEEETRSMVYEIFIEGTGHWENDIARREGQTDPFCEKDMEAYTQLILLHEQMENSSLKDFPGLEGSHEIKTAYYIDARREEAYSLAKAHYAAGMEVLNKGDAQSAREAHEHFTRGLYFRDKVLEERDPELYANLQKQKDGASEQAHTSVVVATSDRNKELMNRLTAVLNEQEQWTTYTAAAGMDLAMRVWSAEVWSALDAPSPAAIKAAYESTHDFLVFLETTSAESEIVDEKKIEPLKNDFLPTENYAIGFKRKYVVSFWLYDLKTGENTAAQTVTLNYTNTVLFIRLVSDRTEKLTFAVNPMSEETTTETYMITDATLQQMNAMRDFLETAFERWNLGKNSASIERYTSFSELRSDYYEAFFTHTDILTADGDSFRGAHTSGGISNDYGKIAGEMFAAMRRHSLKLAAEAMADLSADREKAVQAIANWLKGKL